MEESVDLRNRLLDGWSQEAITLDPGVVLMEMRLFERIKSGWKPNKTATTFEVQRRFVQTEHLIISGQHTTAARDAKS